MGARRRLVINAIVCTLALVLVPSASVLEEPAPAFGGDVGFNWKWLNQLLANATFKFPDTEFPIGA